MDPNGTDYSVKMDGSVQSANTLKVSITRLTNSILTDFLYGALIFDLTDLNTLTNVFSDSLWNSAAADVYSDLDILAVSVTTSYIVGMRGFTMHPSLDLKFAFSTTTYGFTGGASGFVLLQMDFWGYR